MNTNLSILVNEKNTDLTKFLKTDKDGVFYTGHASILVCLNKKKYLFDYINNTNLYGNSWIFFPNQIIDNRLFNVDGVFVSHIHQDHYDPTLLRKYQKKNIPIYILDGRPSFKSSFKNDKIFINLKTDNVFLNKQSKILENCHYFIIEDYEFNLC